MNPPLETRPSQQAWASSVAANFAARACALVTAVLVARVLGPEARGLVAAAMLWPNLLSNLSISNLPTVTYFGARRGAAGIWGCLRIGLPNAIVLVVVALAAHRIFLPVGIQGYADLYAVVIPLAVASTVFGGALLSEGRITEYWAGRFVAGFFTLCAVAVLVALGVLSVRGFVVVTLGGALAALIVAALLQRSIGLAAPPFTKEDRSEIVGFGGRTLLTAGLAQLNLRIDQVMITMLLPVQVLGEYAIAFSWSAIVFVMGAGLAPAILSRSSRADLQSPAEVGNAIVRVRRAGVLVLGAAAVVCVSAPVGILVVFGDQYRGAVAPAMVLSLAAGLMSWKSFFHELARGAGKPSMGRLPELVSLVVRTASLLLLLPLLAGLGAALGSILASTAIVALFIYRLSTDLNVPRGSFFPRMADVGAVTTGTAILLQHYASRARAFGAGNR